MNKFEVGKIYNEDGAVAYEVTKRTAKFVTVIEIHHLGRFNENKRNERKVKVAIWDDTEVLIIGNNTVKANGEVL